MSDDIPKIVLSLLAIGLLALIIIGHPTRPSLGKRCDGAVVETCKPAVRLGWDHGPVIFRDKACKRVCR